jgi:hypothetical protein
LQKNETYFINISVQIIVKEYYIFTVQVKYRRNSIKFKKYDKNMIKLGKYSKEII